MTHNHYARSDAKKLGLSKYSGGKPCKCGLDLRWVSNAKCVSCDAKRKKKPRKLDPAVAKERNQRAYYADVSKSREYARIKQKQAYENNKEQKKEYYEKNKEKIKARFSLYNATEKAKEKRLLRVKAKKENDKSYMLHCRIRHQIYYFLRRHKAKKSATSEVKLLSYDAETLVRHIEKQFLPGMSWDNRDKWHIDHIVPLSSFDANSIYDAWALSNLRPLWATKNREKWAHRIFLI